MTDFKKYGNRMMLGIDSDPEPNPDDYAICPECSEQVHTEDMNHHTIENDDEVCVLCFRKSEHGYVCDGCQGEFRWKGIPARCLLCGSFHIHDEFRWADVDFLIHEEQERYLRVAENAPLATLQIISADRLASVQSVGGSHPRREQ